MCEGNIGFDFTIHSITGQITGLSLVCDKIDPCYDDPEASEKLYKKIDSAALQYKKAARQFLSKKLNAGTVIKCKVTSGSYSGELGGFEWKRITASARCEMTDGTLYHVNFDPQSGEIISWSIWGWGK